MHRHLGFKPFKRPATTPQRKVPVAKKPKVAAKKKKQVPPAAAVPQFPTGLCIPRQPPFVRPFVGNSSVFAEIEDVFKKKVPCILYVHGPIGVGKSELVRVLSRAYHYQVVVPEKKYLHQQWKMRRSDPTVLNFDDIQALHESDHGLISEVTKFFSRSTPCLVYISSTTDAKFKQLRGLMGKKPTALPWIEKRLFRPNSAELISRFGKQIAKRCRGDLRQAQILLEESTMAGAVDVRVNSFEGCRSILDQQCKNAKEAVEIYGKTDNFGNVLLHENYLQNHLEVDDMYACANAFSERYMQQHLDSTALPMTLYLKQSNTDFFRKFNMSMPRRRKANPLTLADIRRLIFKVKGPYLDSIEAQTLYLGLLGQRFKAMTMKSRKEWKQQFGITQQEQKYMLSHSASRSAGKK